MNQRVFTNDRDCVQDCSEWLGDLIGASVDLSNPDAEVINSIASFQIIKCHEEDYHIVAVVNTETPRSFNKDISTFGEKK